MARRKERTTPLGPTRPKKDAKNLTFDEATELLIGDVYLKGQSQETIRWHRENLYVLKKYLQEEGLDQRPAKITEEILQNCFVVSQLKKGLKPNTINGRIRSFRALFKFLYDKGYIKTNPAKNIKLLKLDKPVIETFTQGQIKQLLSAIDIKTFAGFRDYVIILLILETGMRVAEVSQLRVEDISFEEGVIRVSRGKGAKGRLVPFQSNFRKVLRKYLQERGNLPHSFLFITNDEEPIKKRNIQERIHQFGKKAGLTGVRCSPHTLRHTMAKLYIMAGGDIFSLQKILGHSSLDMVRRYVELFANEVKEQHYKFSPLQGMDLDDEE